METSTKRAELFARQVHAASGEERLTIILAELVRQLMELNASVGHMDKMMIRLVKTFEYEEEGHARGELQAQGSERSATRKQ